MFLYKIGAVWEISRLVVWSFSRLGDWEIGRLVVWEIGRLGVWSFSRLGDWEIRRLGVLKAPHPPLLKGKGGERFVHSFLILIYMSAFVDDDGFLFSTL